MKICFFFLVLVITGMQANSQCGYLYAVLDAVHGGGGRRPLDRRQHHAQREVDRVELGRAERSAQAARGSRGACHRRDASGHGASGSILADYRGREAVGGVRRDRRSEGVVLEPSDPPERLAELACVRLRPAHNPRDEGQQRDPNHADELSRLEGRRLRRLLQPVS